MSWIASRCWRARCSIPCAAPRTGDGWTWCLPTSRTSSAATRASRWGCTSTSPHAALYVGGDDPLALIRTTAEQAREALVDGGWLAVEVGHESGADAAALLESLGYTHVELRQDLAGIDRMAAGRRSG